jgi:hypothetical protein
VRQLRAVAAAGLAAVLAGAPARALAGDPASYPVEVVAAIPPPGSAGASSAILLGRSGQLYHPVAPGRWQRRTVGGVAVDLGGAVRAAGEELLAVGTHTPVFRFQGGAWRAEPMSNRGQAALTATGPLPVLAVGRHVYTLESGAWVRRASASKRVSAAWSDGPRALVVATADGALARWNGRRFTPVRTPLASGDAIVGLVGASASALYGRGQSGAWIRIDRGGAAALTLDRDLAGFEEHTYGLGPDGRLWLAGTLPAPDGTRRAAIIRADKDRVVRGSDLPPLAPGDRLVVVMGHAPSGEVLVATRAGAVRVRSRKGIWSEGSASSALPAPPAPTARRGGGPARTR